MTTSETDEYERILILLQLGRLDAARTKLAALLAADPEDAGALLMLGYSWHIDDNPERAIEYLTAGLSHDPDNQMGLRLLALSELMRCEQTEDHRMRVEHYRRAQAAADRCTELDPEDPENLRVLAWVQAPADAAEAVRTLDRALDLDPESADLHWTRGLLLRRGGLSIPQAERALHEALRLDPAHRAAMEELAFLELARGNRAAGERTLRAVAEQHPERGNFVREVLASGKDPFPPPSRKQRMARGAANQVANGLEHVANGMGRIADKLGAPDEGNHERPRRPPDPTAGQGLKRFGKVWLALVVIVTLVRLAACDREVTPPPRLPAPFPTHAPLPTMRPIPSFPRDLPTLPPLITLPPGWTPPPRRQ